MKFTSLFIVLFCLIMDLNAQPKSLQERLGYGPGAKLLIIHADDAAVSHSTNQAIMEAFRKERISSTAVMVPCPWFPEMAEFSRNNPKLDVGLHLSSSSEWIGYKWGGIAPASEITSLLDEQGYFYATTGEAVKHAEIQQLETELRAQIEKALAAGIRPSHFDTHMNTLLGSVELVKLYVRLGEEYQVPVMLDRGNAFMPDSFRLAGMENYPSPRVYEATPDIKPENWTQYYNDLLANLEPGFSVLILHLAYDNEETRAMTRGHDYYNASWRQRDLDYILSETFENALADTAIKIITWGDIGDLIYPEKEKTK